MRCSLNRGYPRPVASRFKKKYRHRIQEHLIARGFSINFFSTYFSAKTEFHFITNNKCGTIQK
uniref:Uncharacterized protein n=1 Tax=Meloidogyne incognita TaxID=6306 RepID=A0A914LYT1_MELIC